MADVFLSYARADRPRAESLAAALERAGYSVWWDRHIAGGSEFSSDIERELGDCRAVIVLWSDAARESPWVKDEAAVGRDAGKLLPVALDTALPPLGFRQYHAIDFSRWNGAAEAAETGELVQTLAARLRGASPPEAMAALPASRRGAGLRRSAWLALALVALATAYVGYSAWRGADRGTPTVAEAVPDPQTPVAEGEEDVPRIAVAEFKVREDDEVVAEFAEALSEDIANGLSRFPYLVVASRSAAQAADAGGIAYRLEGSVRRAGPTLRLTMQLFKTRSGEQVWGESYDRVFDETALLAVQDDLAARVVASVADSYGALMRDLASSAALKAPGDMSAYDSVLRFQVYRQRLGPEDHLTTREALERAAQQAPNDANVWSALAATYTEEYKHDYNVLPGSLDRALDTARRATHLAPDNAYANFVLAEVLFFRQDLGGFRAAAERAIALNPYDSDSMAMIGILIAYGGDWARGLQLAERAMALNPNHPGWYRFGAVFDAFRQGDFEIALDLAQRVNLPLYFPDAYVRAVAHAYLGQDREARQAAQEFLALWPHADLSTFRADIGKWFYAQPGLVDLVVQGLQMAGLDFGPDPADS